MVNFSKFNNIGEFTYNNSLTDNLSEVNTRLLENADTVLGATWINGTIFALFLFLFYVFNNNTNPNKYDITRSLFLSSSISLLASIFLLISKWSTSIYPLYFYGMLSFITMIMVLNLKGKGL